MSMRSSITAMFAACIALPLAAGWAGVWLTAEGEAHQRALEQLQGAARTTMAAVENRMSLNLTHMKAWSSMPMMQDVLVNDESGELAQALANLNRAYPDFVSLTVTNTRGEVVATTDKILRKAARLDADGIKQAIAGRTTQSTSSRLHSDAAPDAIRFTAPLVAAYDRQTVIGTISGAIDIPSVVQTALRQPGLAHGQRMIILARQQDRQALFASRSLADATSALRTIAIEPSTDPVTMNIAGTSGIAALARSNDRILGQDPGLVAIAFEPLSAISAPARRLADTFVALAGLAAIAALIAAWHWTTPLVHVARDLAALLSGGRRPATTTQPAFTQLAKGFDALKAARSERDLLVRQANELSLAVAVARHDASDANERLQHLGSALTAHMGELTELVELINRQNLAAAGSRHRQPQLHDLNRAALDLLHVIREAVEAAHASPSHDSQAAEHVDPKGQRRSA